MQLLSDTDIEELESTSSFAILIAQKTNIASPAIINLITLVYSYCTQNQYDCYQKKLIINALIELLAECHSISLQKHQFVSLMAMKLTKLSMRQSDLRQYFTMEEAENIHQQIRKLILPYYEMYETVLYKNPFFAIHTSTHCVPLKKQKHGLEGNRLIEVEGVEVLKAFVGIRGVKQQKKEGKKK